MNRWIPFYNRSFLQKNLFYNGLVVLLLISLSALLLHRLDQADKVMERMNSVEEKLVHLVHEAEITALQHRRAEKDVFLNLGNVEKQKKYLKTFDKHSELMVSQLNEIRELISVYGEPGIEIQAMIDKSLVSYSAYKEGFKNIAEQVMDTSFVGTSGDANKMMAPIKQSIYEFENTVIEIGERQGTLADAYVNEVLTQSKNAQNQGYTLTALAVIISIISSLILIVSIQEAIKKIVTSMKPILEGDFTNAIDYTKKDEFSSLVVALNHFTKEVANIIKSIKEASKNLDQKVIDLGEVATHSEKGVGVLNHHSDAILNDSKLLVQSTHKVNQNTDVFKTNIQTLVSAIEEMNITITEVAKSCQQEASVSEKANVEVNNSKQLVSQLKESSAKIGKMVKVISEISEQTKLLALNASIEAASAGEAGKGFAVVAEEVKQLASQSANATQEITNLVNEIQKRVMGTIQSSDSIGNSIVEVINISHTIVTAVEEQSATTSEIARSVNTASEQATEISNEMDVSFSSLEKLKSMAEELKEMATHSTDQQKVTKKVAVELNEHSDQLKNMITHYKV